MCCQRHHSIVSTWYCCVCNIINICFIKPPSGNCKCIPIWYNYLISACIIQTGRVVTLRWSCSIICCIDVDPWRNHTTKYFVIYIFFNIYYTGSDLGIPSFKPYTNEFIVFIYQDIADSVCWFACVSTVLLSISILSECTDTEQFFTQVSFCSCFTFIHSFTQFTHSFNSMSIREGARADKVFVQIIKMTSLLLILQFKLS